MTKREAAIVSAYTGYLIRGFEKLHKYIEELCGRSVYTHELGNKSFSEKIHELSKKDFCSMEVS